MQTIQTRPVVTIVSIESPKLTNWNFPRLTSTNLVSHLHRKEEEECTGSPSSLHHRNCIWSTRIYYALKKIYKLANFNNNDVHNYTVSYN